MKGLEHIAARALDTPLVITQSKLDVILNVLAPRLDVAPPAIDAAAANARGREAEAQSEGVVAVVPITGTLVHRSDGISAQSGLATYSMIGDEIEKAVRNPGVQHVVLDIDSPGGEVAGCFDQADRIAALRGDTPITAVVNEQAASGAYALASAADRIVTTRTGVSGSIGVIATHVDRSGADEQAGRKVTHIFAGSRKADLSPHKPLGSEEQQRLQEHVNQYYELLVRTVARNRGMTADAVRRTNAEMYIGRKAVAAGLADAVGTLEEVIADAQQGRTPAAKATAHQEQTPMAESERERVTMSATAEDQSEQASGWERAYGHAATGEPGSLHESAAAANPWDQIHSRAAETEQ